MASGMLQHDHHSGDESGSEVEVLRQQNKSLREKVTSLEGRVNDLEGELEEKDTELRRIRHQNDFLQQNFKELHMALPFDSGDPMEVEQDKESAGAAGQKGVDSVCSEMELPHEDGTSDVSTSPSSLPGRATVSGAEPGGAEGQEVEESGLPPADEVRASPRVSTVPEAPDRCNAGLKPVLQSSELRSITSRADDVATDGSMSAGKDVPVDPLRDTFATAETGRGRGTYPINDMTMRSGEDQSTHPPLFAEHKDASRPSCASTPVQMSCPDAESVSEADSSPTSPQSLEDASSSSDMNTVPVPPKLHLDTHYVSPSAEMFSVRSSDQPPPSPDISQSATYAEPCQTASMTSPTSPYSFPTTKPMSTYFATPNTASSSPLSSLPLSSSPSENLPEQYVRPSKQPLRVRSASPTSCDGSGPGSSPPSLTLDASPVDLPRTVSESGGEIAGEDDRSTGGEEVRGPYCSPDSTASNTLSDIASLEAWQASADTGKAEGDAESIRVGSLGRRPDVWDVQSSASEQSLGGGTDEQSSPSERRKRAGQVGARSPPMQTPAPAGKAIANEPEQRDKQHNSGRFEDVIQRVRQSYLDCGLDHTMLRFTPVQLIFNPMSVCTRSNRVKNAKLTPRGVEKLREKKDKILNEHWLRKLDSNMDGNDPVADRRMVDLIRKLCGSLTNDAEKPGVVPAVNKFSKRSIIARDETRLNDFLKYSVLIVAKQSSEDEYLAAVEALEKGMDQTEKREQKKGGKIKDEKYRWELLGLCCSLHHVLSNLDERWKGLHLVVLVILLRAGTRDLQGYLAHTTRPAAIQMLLKSFNSEGFIEMNVGRIRSLVAKAFPESNRPLERITPLGLLQAALVGKKLSARFVAESLGYQGHYWTKAVVQSPDDSAVRTPQHHFDHARSDIMSTPSSNPVARDFATQPGARPKRSGVSIGGDGDVGTPSKRVRLGHSSDDNADMRRPERIALLHTVESDAATDSSGLQHQGALASTSEASDSSPATSVSPTMLKTPQYPQVPPYCETSTPIEELSRNKWTPPRATTISTDEEEGDAGDAGSMARPQVQEDLAYHETPEHIRKGKRRLGDISPGARVHSRPRLERDEDAPAAKGVGVAPVHDSHPLPLSPSHRQEQSGTNRGAADQLCFKANWLAKELEYRNAEIWTGECPLVSLDAGFCKPCDLRFLASAGRLTDSLLNAIPLVGRLTEAGLHGRGYHLPNCIYGHIRRRNWKTLGDWKELIPAEKEEWVLAIPEEYHRMLVKINWTRRSVQYYDPTGTGSCETSRRVLDDTMEWVRHICGADSIWELEDTKRAQPAAGESEHSDAFVAQVLCNWVRGSQDVQAGFSDPLGFMIDVVRQLQGCPRIPALAKAGEGEICSDTPSSQEDGGSEPDQAQNVTADNQAPNGAEDPPVATPDRPDFNA